MWLAFQTSLRREVAIKIPHENRLRDFLREGLTCGLLDHPNIVPIYQIGRLRPGRADKPLLAMKYIRGKTWRESMTEDRGSRPKDGDDFLAKHLGILMNVCLAVAYAHSKGVIHRDINPGNVLVGEFGEVYLHDWGLSLVVEGNSLDEPGESSAPPIPAAAASRACGTPAYMAPEQATEPPSRIGPHTDIYLLGACLFEVLTCCAPHPGKDAGEQRSAAARNVLRPLDPGCPQDLAVLCRSTLAGDPLLRPSSAKAIHSAIGDFLSGKSRRADSLAASSTAGKLMETALMGPDVYARLSECERLAQQSFTLWPDNPMVWEIQSRVLSSWVEAACARGDLELAAAQARRFPDAEQRELALADVGKRTKLRERHHRQRMFALGGMAILALLLVAVVSGWQVSAANARAAAEAGRRSLAETQMRLNTEQQRAALASVKEKEAAARSALLARLAALMKSEQRLAGELEGVLPLPESLEVDAPGQSAARVPGGADLGFIDSIHALRTERRKLSGELGAELESPPVELLLGEANLAFQSSQGASDYMAAYGEYEAVHAQIPDAPEPLLGMGVAAFRAGEPTSSVLQLVQAVESAEREYGDKHPTYALALALASEASQELDREEEARQYYQLSQQILRPQWSRMTIAIARQAMTASEYGDSQRFALMAAQGPASGDTGTELALADASDIAAFSALRLGQLTAAEDNLDRCMEIRTRLLGHNHPEVVMGLCNRATIRMEAAKYEEAESLFLRFMDQAATLDDLDAEMIVTARLEYATCLERMGKLDAAQGILLGALQQCREHFGARHPRTAYAQNALATCLNAKGLPAEAEVLALDAVQIDRELLGAEHVETLYAEETLADCLRLEGRFEEANTAFARLLGVMLAKAGGATAVSIRIRNNLALTSFRLGGHEEAWSQMSQTVVESERLFGAAHAQTLLGVDNLLGWYPSLPSDMKLARRDVARSLALGNYWSRREDVEVVDRASAENVALRSLEALAAVLDPAMPDERDACKTTTKRALALAELMDLPAEHKYRARTLDALREEFGLPAK
ncbi:serine/threonine protein kinase [Candidatus Poribacteria bacterium]|nr:serine/threonine protein kinase [Candidatus Poribacteria bacterium]